MYQSTRSEGTKVTASRAILKGLADDGGLFVPVNIPKLDVSLEDISKMTYQETAYEVMKLFFTDFTENELKTCIERAYDSKFDTKEIAPLVKKSDAYYLELFHGATIAFKDMALSILPHLLTTSAKKNNVKNEIVILTATSGDTGKAALAGFADVKGTRIIVFYPKDGVSKVQELQMVTQKGENTSVVAIHGNFDNAQSGVKAIFENKELAKEMDAAGYQFSSANSINIGRLVPQIVYYVYAYAKLLKNEEIAEGEQINVVVPTGNFGNILAAYYAKQMGVPIAKLVCASNENKVLFDFFQTGVYDKNREFILTTSPSMDILISSNLERLIYLIAGQDAVKNQDLMRALKSQGVYEISKEMKENLDDFAAGYFNRHNGEVLISSRRFTTYATGKLPFAQVRYGVASPTLTYVDMFQMKDGTEFDWNNPDHNKFPFFDKDGNPRRDIRLYETVAVNGDKFKGAQKVQIFEGTTQSPYKDGRMSYNGFAMRKFIRNFNDEVNGKFYSCPLIRLPEVYLNMAEAMNELNKAEVRDEFGNTAYDYLNKTRERAGMPAISAADVPAGKPLREAILRERAIEFGYEEVRYFDLIRWKRADIFTGQLSRLIIKKAAGEPSGFSYKVSHAMAETRQYAKPEKWNDKYFLLPLPVDEINKKYGLIQNPGW